MPQLDDAFGHWFSGFVAGEGCFHIQKTAGIAKFLIALREDDLPVLKLIQRKVGFGALRYRPAEKRKNARPTYCYTVENWRQCLALIPIFEKFQLRAKKAKEFRLWREALFAWRDHKPKARIAQIAERLKLLR